MHDPSEGRTQPGRATLRSLLSRSALASGPTDSQEMLRAACTKAGELGSWGVFTATAQCAGGHYRNVVSIDSNVAVRPHSQVASIAGGVDLYMATATTSQKASSSH